MARAYRRAFFARSFQTSPPSLSRWSVIYTGSRGFRGFYDLLDGRDVVLFRERGGLYLWWGEGVHHLNTLAMTHSRDGLMSCLVITVASQQTSLTYRVHGEIEDDFTQTEPEDFDFGLFLMNVRQDLERQEILFTRG